MNILDLRGLSVDELLSDTTSLKPDTPIRKVIGHMRENNLNEAFVEENGRTGIVTLRSLLGVQNIGTTKLATVTSYIPRMSATNTLGDAAALMFEYRIRSVPVYEKGKLKGQVNASAVIERTVDVQQTVRADRLMTPDPICIDASDEVAKARGVMIRRKIDQLPVTRESKLDSAITSSAIVFNMVPQSDRLVSANARPGRFDVPVESFSTGGVVQNEASDRAKDVFENMRRNVSTYSVITNFDEIQGIITHRDFMKIIMNTRDSGAIPMYIVGLPEDPFEAEATREKFTRVIQQARRAMPEVLEARAVIKAGETKAPRKRFRVHVFIMTPRQRYSYTASGFELPDVFDQISRWAKQLAGSDNARPRRRRTRFDPGALV